MKEGMGVRWLVEILLRGGVVVVCRMRGVLSREDRGRGRDSTAADAECVGCGDGPCPK